MNDYENIIEHAKSQVETEKEKKLIGKNYNEPLIYYYGNTFINIRDY